MDSKLFRLIINEFPPDQGLMTGKNGRLDLASGDTQVLTVCQLLCGGTRPITPRDRTQYVPQRTEGRNPFGFRPSAFSSGDRI